jgi:hypothetical protein
MHSRSSKYALCAAAAVLSAACALQAQPPKPLHAAVYCVKTVPGKGVEYERFVTEVWRKVVQVRRDARRISGWTFSRAVTPAGEEARCDYLTAYFYDGSPPPPEDTLSADLKKAGLTMTAEELVARRGALSKLVMHERAVRAAGYGATEKGDYWQVNFMKPLPGKGGEFMEFERKVYMPLSQDAARSGHPRKAWGAWQILYPSGTGMAYDAVTVDVFRDWDSIWKSQQFPKEVVERVFPGKTYAELMAPLPGLRNLVRRELYVVVDTLSSAAPGKSP